MLDKENIKRTDLFTYRGQWSTSLGQLLKAYHHPLISEVIRKGFHPLAEQLEVFGGGIYRLGHRLLVSS